MIRTLSALAFTWLVAAASGFAAATEPALEFDRDQFEAAVQKNLEDALAQALAAGQEQAEAAAAKLRDDAQRAIFLQVRRVLEKNANYRELRDRMQVERDRAEALARQFLRRAIGDLSSVEAAIKDYRTGRSKEIIDKVREELALARKEIRTILNLAEAAKEAKVEAEFTGQLEAYGLSGAWIKKLGTREKLLRETVMKIQEDYGDYYDIYQKLTEGLGGESRTAGLSAMFSIMSEHGGKVPIIGRFIRLYGEVASEMLKAAERLRGALAKWDDGCVGLATHDTLTPKQKAFNAAYDGRQACPIEGIPGVYQDSEAPGKFYCWDDASWIATRRGSGGIPDIKFLQDLLTQVKNSFPDAGVRNDGPTLFALYDIEHPDGARALALQGEKMLKDIRTEIGRLRDLYVIYGLGDPGRFQALITERSLGKDKLIQEYLKDDSRRALFQLRYLTGYMKERTGAFEATKKVYDSLKALNLHVIYGRIESPSPFRTVKIDAKLTGGGTLREQAARAGDKDYGIVVEAAPGSSLTFVISSESATSKRLAVSEWGSIREHRITVKLGGTELKVSFNPQEKAAQWADVALPITIEGGEPPFRVEWRKKGERIEELPMTMERRASTRVSFDRTGRHQVWATVTEIATTKRSEGSSVTAEATIDVSNLDLKLSASAMELAPGAPVKIQVTVTGGTKPYTISGDISLNLQDSTATGTLNMPNEPGSYPINVMVRDKVGATVERSMVLRVKAGAVAAKTAPSGPATATSAASKPAASGGGKWVLVDRKAYTENAPGTSLGGASHDWGAYSVRGSWGTPPATLTPGESITLQCSANLNSKDKTKHGAYIGCQTSWNWDAPNIAPGFANRSQVVIASASCDFSKNQISDSKSGTFKVPTGSTGQKMALKCTFSGGQSPTGASFTYEFK